MGCRAALGVLGWSSEPPPWGQLVPMAPCTAGRLGRGEHSCRDGYARNTTTQRKPLLGTLQPLNRTWHFLHLPPALGPRHARGAPKTQLRYLYLYTYTYIHEQGWVCSRVTNGTKSQSERCTAWRAVTPHSKHRGWNGLSTEAWGKAKPKPAAAAAMPGKGRWRACDNQSSPKPLTV